MCAAWLKCDNTFKKYWCLFLWALIDSACFTAIIYTFVFCKFGVGSFSAGFLEENLSFSANSYVIEQRLPVLRDKFSLIGFAEILKLNSGIELENILLKATF